MEKVPTYQPIAAEDPSNSPDEIEAQSFIYKSTALPKEHYLLELSSVYLFLTNRGGFMLNNKKKPISIFVLFFCIFICCFKVQAQTDPSQDVNPNPSGTFESFVIYDSINQTLPKSDHYIGFHMIDHQTTDCSPSCSDYRDKFKIGE